MGKGALQQHKLFCLHPFNSKLDFFELQKVSVWKLNLYFQLAKQVELAKGSGRNVKTYFQNCQF